MKIKRFIYMSKFYLRFFFMFLLPVLPLLIFLEFICLGIKLIPDKLADAILDITEKTKLMLCKEKGLKRGEK